jgi:hypothetical protein
MMRLVIVAAAVTSLMACANNGDSGAASGSGSTVAPANSGDSYVHPPYNTQPSYMQPNYNERSQ